MAKKKPLRFLHVVPEGTFGVKFAFTQYASPSDIRASRIKFYRPSVHSINRVRRFLDQRKHSVNIDPAVGISVLYTFPRRVK